MLPTIKISQSGFKECLKIIYYWLSAAENPMPYGIQPIQKRLPHVAYQKPSWQCMKGIFIQFSLDFVKKYSSMHCEFVIFWNVSKALEKPGIREDYQFAHLSEKKPQNILEHLRTAKEKKFVYLHAKQMFWEKFSKSIVIVLLNITSDLMNCHVGRVSCQYSLLLVFSGVNKYQFRWYTYAIQKKS